MRQDQTLFEVLVAHSQNHVTCNRTAVIDCDSSQELTWRELVAESATLASGILQQCRGIEPSALIGVTRDPMTSFLLMVAAWKIGTMYLPINPSLRPPEVGAVLKTLAGEDYLLVSDANEIERWSVHAKVISIEELREPAPSGSVLTPRPAGSGSKFRLGLMTSGSTGGPKLIRHSAHNLIQAAMIEVANDPDLNSKRVLNIRPHFTSSGCNSMWPTIYSAGTLLFSQEASRISRFPKIRETFQKFGVDLFIASPSMLHSLLESDDGSPLAVTSSPMKTYYGGMAIAEDILKRLSERGLSLRMRYGMTEIAHIVSTTSPNTGSVGKPFRGIEIDARAGYLWFRGEGVADSCNKTEDGWFKSDDLGALSEQGEILLRGREHSIVNVNGFRFPLDETAKVLALHPSVSRVAVLARNNVRSGAELLAFFQTQNNPVATETELRKLAEEKLSSFKRPTEYVHVGEWPYTDNGKTNTQALWALTKKKD